MKQKIIFWVKDVDELLSGSEKVAGIQVQISFWARTFHKNGWNTYCLTDKNSKVIEGINFIKSKVPQILVRLHLSLLGELYDDLRIILKIKPSYIVCRGAGRYLYLLSLACKLSKTRLVFMGASDVNFVPGKDTVTGSEKYTKLYRKSIKNIDYFITQNKLQAETLKNNYNRDSLTLENIWIPSEVSCQEIQYDFIWVANFRKLKRAEWFIDAAQRHPDYSFALVGGVSDQLYYDEMKTKAERIGNLYFLGPKPLSVVNELIASSRVLCCTSEYEGFPNTFIQAWAYGVPVLSTVDPSGIVKINNLGIVCQTQDDFDKGIESILSNAEAYSVRINNISNYFHANHDADQAYKRMIKWINVK